MFLLGHAAQEVGAEPGRIAGGTLSGHVLPALVRAAPVARVEDSARVQGGAGLSVTVVLRRSDPAGFRAYLGDVYDPSSPNFRQFLSPSEVTALFGPSQEDYDLVLSHFQSHGFILGGGSANRMTLTLRGTRASASRALSVEIRDYQSGGNSFHANDAEPVLPQEIAARVEAVVGLSSLAAPRPAAQALNSAFCAIYARVAALLPLTDKNGTVWAPSSTELVNKIYRDCMIDKHADGYGNLQKADPPPPAWQGVTGIGQTVGITAFDTFEMSDVRDFIEIAGLPPETIDNVLSVHVGGGASPGANQDEVLLDIDTVLGTAPAARVVVYDAPFAGGSFQGLFNAMINDGVDIISNSWAYCEDQTTAADVQSIDSILQTAAASGISVFSASGDHGSTCLDGSPNTVHVPASSPHVTAVGGTSLTLGPGYTYGTETWWDGSMSAPPTGQGGFGVSRFFSRPSYQDGLTTSSQRSVPDVASNADPAKGVQICQASAGGCPSGRYYGGTSKSAPAWAAFTALLNQAQGSNLGFLNPLIYPFAGTDAFHDGASMGSDFAHVGLGSPNLARLHQYLTSQEPGPVDPTVSLVAAYTEGNTFAAPNTLNLPLPALADGSSRSYVVVRLADSFGNIVSGKTVTLSATPGSQVVITPPSGVSSNDNGAVIFAVTNLSYETVTFTATNTTDGVVLADTPSVQFLVPPAVSAGIRAEPAAVPPNGTSTATITVTLKDALDRPAPGKHIALLQGAGHSVIVGPSPPVTDANGEIRFTAANRVSETVVYTAIDKTDGDLPIPGSATVDFTGFSTSCVAAPPAPAPAYTITPFATGFPAQNFFYGNVNWGGCPGASNPTFAPSGAVYVADFFTGDFYRFELAGGAVTSGNILSNLGQTLGQPTFGKDGRLYATHGATTGNFFTGNIIEIDPETGAQIRVVAANLTCPNGLAVDPLSGDLFFDDSCTGAGSDNPSLWRVHDPAGAATLSVYATLPRTANGSIAFAPDGTIFVVTGYYNNPNAPVVRIAGTDKPSPPEMTILPDIGSSYWVTLAEAMPDGSARSLLVYSEGSLTLVDITTQPYTRTVLTASPPTTIGTGIIGPDGCLYASGSDTIYRLSPAEGGCGFAPTNPAPILTLSPTVVSPDPGQGSTLAFTAQFKNVDVPEGTPVTFSISGANTDVRLARTDASGAATIALTGAFAGSDTIVAFGSSLRSNDSRVAWTPGRHVTAVGLDSGPSGAAAGRAVTLRASLSDMSLDPQAAIEGATIQFSVGGQSCSAVTDSRGVASCSLTLPAGEFSLTAVFDGTEEYRPSAAQQRFDVLVVPASGGLFHRADPNQSGRTDISDAVAVFGYLFLGSETPGCLESADTDNSGRVDISDGIATLNWLFLGGREPAPPGPPGSPCGEDPDAPGSAGDLGCVQYAPCG